MLADALNRVSLSCDKIDVRRYTQTERHARICLSFDRQGLPYPLHEPRAAAIAYRLEMSPMHENRRVLVFHLGRSTLTITHLLIKSENRFDVWRDVSDLRFGGDTFTDRVADHSAKEFEPMYYVYNNNICRDSYSVKKLWSAREMAKIYSPRPIKPPLR
jgi:hypothetical protein